jgi:integrase
VPFISACQADNINTQGRSWARQADHFPTREKGLYDAPVDAGDGYKMPRRKSPPRLYLDTKRNQWIVRDGANFIRTGCGHKDSTAAEGFLAEYLVQKYEPGPSPSPLIADVLLAYGNEVVPHKKTARKISYNISNLLKWWGTKKVADVSAKSCRTYAATKKLQGAGADLKFLKLAIAHWHREYGPLNSYPTFWRPQPNPAKERWLTRSEAARLLWEAKPYLHLRRFILLGLYTGSRPGVLLALRWDQIDLGSAVMSRLPRGAKPDPKKRAPKVKLGRRILAHMRRWKRLDGEIKFVCHYEGRPVEDPHGSWRRIVEAAGLDGVTRHTLRHTRATWMAQKGVPLFEAAGFLGMTVKTLESVYGHHHPDWQDRAANI